MLFHQTPPPVDSRKVWVSTINRRSAATWPGTLNTTPLQLSGEHSRLPTRFQLLLPSLETPRLQDPMFMENMPESFASPRDLPRMFQLDPVEVEPDETLIFPLTKKPRKRFVLQPRRRTNDRSPFDLETVALPAKRLRPPSFLSLDRELEQHIDLRKDPKTVREEEPKDTDLSPVVFVDSYDKQSRSCLVHSNEKFLKGDASFTDVEAETKDAKGIIALPRVFRPTKRGDMTVLALQAQGSSKIHNTLVPSRSSAFMPAGVAA